MSLLEEVKKRISEIETDDRYKAEPANVNINAPLALIQMAMKGQIFVLKWVEKELETE